MDSELSNRIRKFLNDTYFYPYCILFNKKYILLIYKYPIMLRDIFDFFIIESEIIIHFSIIIPTVKFFKTFWEEKKCCANPVNRTTSEDHKTINENFTVVRLH